MSEKRPVSKNTGISLTVKTILIVVLTSTLFLSLFGWYRHRETSRRLEQAVQETLALSVDRLALSLKSPLYDYDDEALEAVISAEMKSLPIVGVFVMNGENILHGYTRMDGEIVGTDTLLPSGGHIVAEKKLSVLDTELGDVKVFATLRYLREDLRRSLIAIVSEVLVLDIILMLVLTLFIRFIVIKPLNRLIFFINKISKGDISEISDAEIVRSQGDRGDELGILANAVLELIRTTDEITRIAEEIGHGNMMMKVRERSENDRLMRALDSMIQGLRETVRVAEKIAEGDLGVKVKHLSEKDILGKSLEKMVRDLIRFAAGVREASEKVAAGAEQISAAAEQISQGTSQQASGIEQISASMEEMNSTITQNADNARQTAVIASQAALDAKEGGRVLAETVQAMTSISEKIMIIEEIARQTNMLSLNASIEAARAREHGKGFAVVANEVGLLAGRTQEAARVIKELSASNIEIAGKASELTENMVAGIGKTADLVQEISASCSEQAAGTEQVNNAIQEQDQAIQQNAASTEEMASSSREFASSAESLLASVSFFKLPESILEEDGEPDMEELEEMLRDKKILAAFHRLFEKLEKTGDEGRQPGGENRKNPGDKAATGPSAESEPENGSEQLREAPKTGKMIDLSGADDSDFIPY